MKRNKTAEIQTALQSGDILTVRSISRRWDVNCPYSVIRDIRKRGVDVKDRLCENMDGVRYKEYYV